MAIAKEGRHGLACCSVPFTVLHLCTVMPVVLALPRDAAVPAPTLAIRKLGTGGFLRRDQPSHKNIPYKWVARTPIELDIHHPVVPANGGDLPPAIMYIHPGAWMYGNSKLVEFAVHEMQHQPSGAGAALSSKVRVPAQQSNGRWSDKRDLNRHIRRALDMGVAIVSVNYRLTTEGAKYPGANVTWPAQGQDIADAMVWIRENGGKYGLDSSRVGCWGESAGGHLCAWLAAAGGVKTHLRPDVAVDFCGPTCFLCTHDVKWLGHTPADWLFGYKPGTLQMLKHHELDQQLDGNMKEQINLVRSAEPLAWVNDNTSPMFIGHGTADTTVPIYKAELLASRLERAKTQYMFQEVDGGGHMYYKWPDKVIDDALRFSLAHFSNPTMLPATTGLGSGTVFVGRDGTTSPKVLDPSSENDDIKLDSLYPYMRKRTAAEWKASRHGRRHRKRRAAAATPERVTIHADAPVVLRRPSTEQQDVEGPADEWALVRAREP